MTADDFPLAPGRYSTPFANGFEVDWFRANRCDRCVLDHPDGGGCDEFALGVVVEGGWATDGRLVPVDIGLANPLGVECQRFQPAPPRPPQTTAGHPRPAAYISPPTKEAHRG